jgi:RNA polymerase sigma-70 factor (ECF subfamily)
MTPERRLSYRVILPFYCPDAVRVLYGRCQWSRVRSRARLHNMPHTARALRADADSSVESITVAGRHLAARQPQHRVGFPVATSSRHSVRDGKGNGVNRSVTGSVPDRSVHDVVLPHLDAAYRLARWLLRNEHDAEDAVQDACVRALRYFHTFAGGNARAWFLRIVRHVCWSRRANGFPLQTDSFDEERHSATESTLDPETRLIQIDDVALVGRALSTLPDRFRELVVLRELEGLSYRELADVIGVPLGTVMSGLSRARQALRRALTDQQMQPGIPARTHPREQEDKDAAHMNARDERPTDQRLYQRLRFTLRWRQGSSSQMKGRIR